MPTSKDKCIFNEETKDKIYQLYRESNLAVMEYANSVLSDERMKEYLSKYKSVPADIDEQDTELVDIFWEAMDYLGMSEYIRQRESKI